MSEQEKIVSCYQEMYRGMISKDKNVLLEVLDDSFVLVHMTGLRQSKMDFIRPVEDGTLNYYSAVYQRMDASVHGSQAELIGQSMDGRALPKKPLRRNAFRKSDFAALRQKTTGFDEKPVVFCFISNALSSHSEAVPQPD